MPNRLSCVLGPDPETPEAHYARKVVEKLDR
jgi:hypothetical protein